MVFAAIGTRYSFVLAQDSSAILTQADLTAYDKEKSHIVGRLHFSEFNRHPFPVQVKATDSPIAC
jgi:hypothetical protein